MAKQKANKPPALPDLDLDLAGEDGEESVPAPGDLGLSTIVYHCARCGIGERRWEVIEAQEVEGNRIHTIIRCLGCKAELPYQDDKEEIIRRSK
jgi:hypothetical protein